ncbi:UbiA prenyltransferase family-domain-containing protein [Hypoxylon rubiginosum]|uniref:UbiA prenyltransferase family-domain-containing protein n=1 Tax=Hypoxylon rubiginosum TaxID=110542 RepID=A0ACB9YXS2_9PEZI|nr:UbiA prenyltransferase family-domain-containing protein [Hypoxylon rubiginosum]
MASSNATNDKQSLPKAIQPRDLSKQYGGAHTGAWVSYLPPSWVPYVQLARLSPPAGVFIVYFPHLFGVIHAAIQQHPPASEVLTTCAVMLGGSFFYSNAIHAWNDLVDAPVDRLVARTRRRPIPRGAVSPLGAFVFTATQAAAAALVMIYFLPPQSALYAAPNIIPTTYYPWAKRHTYFSQVVLGVWLAWGVFMGSIAMGVAPYVVDFANAEFGVNKSSVCLYLSCVLWTVIYDTIYAHQDIEDDTKIGMKSLAVLLRDRTKFALYFVVGAMTLLLNASGQYANMSFPFYIFGVLGSLLSLAAMVMLVDLADPTSCWWWFRNGFWLTGSLISVGLFLEYMLA